MSQAKIMIKHLNYLDLVFTRQSVLNEELLHVHALVTLQLNDFAVLRVVNNCAVACELLTQKTRFLTLTTQFCLNLPEK